MSDFDNFLPAPEDFADTVKELLETIADQVDLYADPAMSTLLSGRRTITLSTEEGKRLKRVLEKTLKLIDTVELSHMAAEVNKEMSDN